MKNDNMTKLITFMIDEIGIIKDEPIKPAKKLRKLARLEQLSKDRFEKLKASN